MLSRSKTTVKIVLRIVILLTAIIKVISVKITTRLA